MSSPVRPEPSGSRIERNIAALRSQGASEQDIEAYLTDHEGLKPITAPTMAARDATSALPTPRRTGQSIGQALTGAAEQMNQGATFGLSDEIGAFVGGLIANPRHPLKNYDALRKEITQPAQQFAAEHPVLATTANIAGGLEGGLMQGGVAGAVRGAPLVAKTGGKLLNAAKAIGSGAAVGGAAAAGSADGGLDERLKAVPRGAAFGAGTVLGLKGAGALSNGIGLTGLLKNVMPRAASAESRAGQLSQRMGVMTTPDLAKADVIKQLQRAGLTVSDVADRAVSAHPEQMLLDAEVGGQSMLRRARGVQSIPSRGSEQVERALVTRNEGAPSRIQSLLESESGHTKDNSVLRAEQLKGERSATAAVNYPKAYDAPPINDPEILAIFQDPAFQKAHAVARRLAASEGHELPPLMRVVPELTEEATAAPPLVPTPPKPSMREAINQFQEGIAQAAQRSEGTPAQQLARAALDRRAAEAALPSPPPSVTPPVHSVAPPQPGEDFAAVPVQAFDWMKHGLDDLIETGANGTRTMGRNEARILRNKLAAALDAIDADPAYAPYAEARRAFREQSRGMEAQQLGSKLFTTKNDALEATVPSLPPSAQDEFRRAALGATEERLAGVPEGGNAASALTRNDLLKQKIRMLFPNDESANRVMALLDAEKAMHKNASFVLGGSPTARITAEQADELGNPIADVTNAATGNVSGLLTKLMTNGVAARMRGLSEQQSSALAPLLTARGADLQQVLDQLRQFAAQQAAQQAKMRLLPRSIGQTVGGSTASHK